MVNAKWGRQGWLSENWNYPLKESLNDQVSFKCHHSKKRQSNSYAGNFKFQYRCCHYTQPLAVLARVKILAFHPKPPVDPSNYTTK